MMTETLEAQIDRLANFIMAEIPGEPSQSEGAVDTAIRWMRSALAARSTAPEAGKAVDAEARIVEILDQFHRNSCYPHAQDFEIEDAAASILAALASPSAEPK